MTVRRLVWVAVALCLFVPSLGLAGEGCPATPSEPSLEALLDQGADAAPAASAAEGAVAFDLFAPLPMANFCTKEVCSVNRMDCRNGCAPCGFAFQCNFPGCNSCNCLC